MAKGKFEPRELMEMAIEVMRHSVLEPRKDGKPCPVVGAVIRKADGTVETACRGEFRHGDHAEYTLIDRKNRSNKLDDAILFTTLEPCAPGSREPPKMSCAERIANARVKEVWVGIEDPDPTVDRKGIKYLQEAGIEVNMFERDLQERIRAENEGFLSEALERAAAAAEEKAAPVILSALEAPVRTTELNDFSLEALERYRDALKLQDTVTSEGFHRRLVQLGVLGEEDGRRVPTGFGLLLFGKEPRLVIPQAGLLGTIHDSEGREEPKDFDGPLVFTTQEALQWLRDKLPNPIDRSEARRRQVNDTLYELVREGVTNALIHRDYAIQQAKCQLEVTSETITIKSPGGPVEPITLEQMQSFEAPMLSRNPVLHYIFAQLELAEERGLGLKSMKTRAQGAGLPLPRYTWENPYLVLTVYRSSAAAVRMRDRGLLERLNPDERATWQYIVGRETSSSAEVMEELGFDERKAQRILRKLQDAGVLRRVGRGPATRYQVK